MKELQFEWDQWNLQKNEIKHGVAFIEAESCFFDDEKLIFVDEKHVHPKEIRYIMFGMSIERRVLTLVFTMRKHHVRVISARPASRKERDIYDKALKRDN